MATGSIRAFALARQLNVDWRDVVIAANALGIEVPKHTSLIPAESRQALEERIKATVPPLPAPSPSGNPSVADDSLDARLDDFENAELEDLEADDLDDDDLDDLDDDDDEHERGGTGGGYRVDDAEERELEGDDVEDHEADGPEEYGCDPDYDGCHHAE